MATKKKNSADGGGMTRTEMLEAGGKLVGKAKAAEASGEARDALVFYEDALYYLGNDLEIEKRLDKLRDEVGRLVAGTFGQMEKLEKEILERADSSAKDRVGRTEAKKPENDF